jgi:hypothetical protein
MNESLIMVFVYRIEQNRKTGRIGDLDQGNATFFDRQILDGSADFDDVGYSVEDPERALQRLPNGW